MVVRIDRALSWTLAQIIDAVASAMIHGAKEGDGRAPLMTA